MLNTDVGLRDEGISWAKYFRNCKSVARCHLMLSLRMLPSYPFPFVSLAYDDLHRLVECNQCVLIVYFINQCCYGLTFNHSVLKNTGPQEYYGLIIAICKMLWFNVQCQSTDDVRAIPLCLWQTKWMQKAPVLRAFCYCASVLPISDIWSLVVVKTTLL